MSRSPAGVKMRKSELPGNPLIRDLPGDFDSAWLLSFASRRVAPVLAHSAMASHYLIVARPVHLALVAPTVPSSIQES